MAGIALSTARSLFSHSGKSAAMLMLLDRDAEFMSTLRLLGIVREGYGTRGEETVTAKDMVAVLTDANVLLWFYLFKHDELIEHLKTLAIGEVQSIISALNSAFYSGTFESLYTRVLSEVSELVSGRTDTTKFVLTTSSMQTARTKLFDNYLPLEYKDMDYMKSCLESLKYTVGLDLCVDLDLELTPEEFGLSGKVFSRVTGFHGRIRLRCQNDGRVTVHNESVYLSYVRKTRQLTRMHVENVIKEMWLSTYPTNAHEYDADAIPYLLFRRMCSSLGLKASVDSCNVFVLGPITKI